MDAPFEMAVNMFTDMTDEEFRAGHTGAIVPKERSEAMKDFEFPNPGTHFKYTSLLGLG